MHWMRPKRIPSVAASVRTSRVFATPGTPSYRLWPEQSSVTTDSRTASSCPMTTAPIAERIAAKTSATHAGFRPPVAPAASSRSVFMQSGSHRILSHAPRLPDDADRGGASLARSQWRVASESERSRAMRSSRRSSGKSGRTPSLAAQAAKKSGAISTKNRGRIGGARIENRQRLDERCDRGRRHFQIVFERAARPAPLRQHP